MQKLTPTQLSLILNCLYLQLFSLQEGNSHDNPLDEPIQLISDTIKSLGYNPQAVLDNEGEPIIPITNLFTHTKTSNHETFNACADYIHNPNNPDMHPALIYATIAFPIYFGILYSLRKIYNDDTTTDCPDPDCPDDI